MSSADARSAISYPTRCASTSPPTGCITRGLMVKSLFTKILGSRFKRELKRLRPVVDGILRHERSEERRVGKERRHLWSWQHHGRDAFSGDGKTHARTAIHRG